VTKQNFLYITDHHIFIYVGYEIDKISCKLHSASYEAHKRGHTVLLPMKILPSSAW